MDHTYILLNVSKSKKENDNNSFQYVITAALNHENIGKNPKRIVRIRLFINQLGWKEKGFLSEVKDWKSFETNDKSLALNVLLLLIILPKHYTQAHLNNVSLVLSMSQSKTANYIQIIDCKKNCEAYYEKMMRA